MAQCVSGQRVVMYDRLRKKQYDEAGVHDTHVAEAAGRAVQVADPALLPTDRTRLADA